MALLKQEKFKDCLRELEKLQEHATNEIYERGSLTPWHEEEILSLKSLVLEEAGQVEAAIATRIELGETHFERAKSHCESAGFSYAVAAKLLFEAGCEDRACKLAEKAVQLCGMVISMPKVVLEVAARFEQVKERKAREANENQ